MRKCLSLSLAVLGAAALVAPLAAQNVNYGAAMASSRTDLLIGQPDNQYAPGIVYVYRADARGAWKQAAKLNADGATNGDGFGRAIALDGSTALISTVAADSSRGMVYVFGRDRAGAWKAAGTISRPDDAEPNDRFGRKVAVAGDVAVVSSAHAGGSVYVYRRSGGQWTMETTLTPSDSETKDWYGNSVALDGGRLYVGASSLGGGRADSASGAVYVYSRGSDGSWSKDARITPGTVNTARAGFGVSLVPHGDSLWVGSPGYDRGTGAVFLYTRDSDGKWSQGTHLLPFDATPRTLFGVGLASVGDELWVGAPGASQFKGVVYRFSRDTDGWTGASKLAIPGIEDQPQTLAGFSILAVGAQGAVGVPGKDFQEGAVALFNRGPAGWRSGGLLEGEVATLPALTGAKRECTGGKVSIFDCSQVDLMAFVPVKDIGGKRGVEVNDIWGYKDPQTGREYALVGRLDGTSFVDITDPMHPIFVGDLPKTKTAQTSVWRDIKTYKHYAFIVADGAREHGMQVFDLNRLRNPAKVPATFTEDAHYSNVHSVHNVVVDTASGYAFLVGASAGGEMCGGALHMVDIRNPLQPTFAGCFADSTTGRSGTGYTHDAQCVNYHGPDARYRGREICINFSETAIGIADVTDKSHPKALSHQSYPNVGYSHQGWLTEDQHYVYADDELDEIQGLVDGTRTLIWDVSDLENPVLAGEYISPNKAIDHNLFVVGDRVYESNYLSGLRVLDITDRLHPKAAGFFDTVPVGPDEAQFGGSWGNYPFFPSGVVAVTSMKEGLFLLRARPVGVVP